MWKRKSPRKTYSNTSTFSLFQEVGQSWPLHPTDEIWDLALEVSLKLYYYFLIFQPSFPVRLTLVFSLQKRFNQTIVNELQTQIIWMCLFFWEWLEMSELFWAVGSDYEYQMSWHFVYLSALKISFRFQTAFAECFC